LRGVFAFSQAFALFGVDGTPFLEDLFGKDQAEGHTGETQAKDEER